MASAPGGPFVWWATIGMASVVLMVVVLARWVHRGPDALPPGTDSFSAGRLLGLRVLEVVMSSGLIGVLAWHVGRPALRRRPLDFDGLLVLGFLLLNFWDPLDNYLRFAFQYNAHFLNVGSWAADIPGWRSPGGHLWVLPVGFVFGAYVIAFYGTTRLGCVIVARREGRPSPGRLAGAYGANVLLAAAAEILFLRVHAIVNVATPPALTAWYGHQGAWPLYNPFLFGAAFTAPVLLRCTRDDRGRSFVERGIPDRLGRRSSTLMRFLAIAGFLQVTWIGLYFVPWNLLATGAARDPRSLPSYFPLPCVTATPASGGDRTHSCR